MQRKVQTGRLGVRKNIRGALSCIVVAYEAFVHL